MIDESKKIVMAAFNDLQKALSEFVARVRETTAPKPKDAAGTNSVRGEWHLRHSQAEDSRPCLHSSITSEGSYSYRCDVCGYLFTTFGQIVEDRKVNYPAWARSRGQAIGKKNCTHDNCVSTQIAETLQCVDCGISFHGHNENWLARHIALNLVKEETAKRKQVDQDMIDKAKKRMAENLHQFRRNTNHFHKCCDHMNLVYTFQSGKDGTVTYTCNNCHHQHDTRPMYPQTAAVPDPGLAEYIQSIKRGRTQIDAGDYSSLYAQNVFNARHQVRYGGRGGGKTLQLRLQRVLFNVARSNNHAMHMPDPNLIVAEHELTKIIDELEKGNL